MKPGVYYFPESDQIVLVKKVKYADWIGGFTFTVWFLRYDEIRRADYIAREYACITSRQLKRMEYIGEYSSTTKYKPRSRESRIPKLAKL